MDLAEAEGWIRAHVEPVGAIETAHERPWATVLRVPVADGIVWFKACAPVQAFEPRLSAAVRAVARRRRRGPRPRRGARLAAPRRRGNADRDAR